MLGERLKCAAALSATVKTTYHVVFGEADDDVTVGYGSVEKAEEMARALDRETTGFEPYVVAIRG